MAYAGAGRCMELKIGRFCACPVLIASHQSKKIVDAFARSSTLPHTQFYTISKSFAVNHGPIQIVASRKTNVKSSLKTRSSARQLKEEQIDSHPHRSYAYMQNCGSSDLLNQRWRRWDSRGRQGAVVSGSSARRQRPHTLEHDTYSTHAYRD